MFIMMLLQQQFVNLSCIIMQDDKTEGVNDEFRSSCRRSRKDEEGRDYICGCGKKYLSYPALYTHIKTKHDGVQPEGTQKTGNNSNFKRPKPKIDDQVLKSILSLLEKKDLNILNELSGALQGSVPILQRIRRDILPKEIYEFFHTNIVKLSSYQIDKTSSVEMLLIGFLINVGEFVSQSLYVYFLQFAKIVRNCFYEHGAQVFQYVFKEKTKNLHPFSINECRYLPTICDFMIRYYIPADHREANSNIMELILCDLCKWMWKLKLTQVHVTFKKTQQNKNIIGNGWRNITKNNQVMELNNKQYQEFGISEQQEDHMSDEEFNHQIENESQSGESEDEANQILKNEPEKQINGH